MAKLQHYGVLGMKWGRRKGGGSVTVGPGIRGKVIEVGGLFKDAIKDDISKISRVLPKPRKSSEDSAAVKNLVKTKKLHEMTNKELQQVITRMNLEKQFSSLNPKVTNRGKGIVSKILANIAGKAANAYFRQQAGPNYAGYEAFAEAIRGKKS